MVGTPASQAVTIQIRNIVGGLPGSTVLASTTFTFPTTNPPTAFSSVTRPPLPCGAHPASDRVATVLAFDDLRADNPGTTVDQSRHLARELAPASVEVELLLRRLAANHTARDDERAAMPDELNQQR